MIIAPFPSEKLVRLHAGTSGFSYKEWKGPFYPERLPQKEMLHFYAERLPAVEINNTFYRMPKAEVVSSWADQVPEHFRFSIKASRRITHFKRLNDVDEETKYLLRVTSTLGDRRGVILFQLPPNMKADLPRLESFLDLLPEDLPAAFEFRHESWRDDRVESVLADRDLALCVSDTKDSPANAELPAASWGYLRLRREDYTRADLAAWAQRIQIHGWNEAFIFFKHEDEAAGPKMAAEFLDLAHRAEDRKQPVESRPKQRRRAS